MTTATTAFLDHSVEPALVEAPPLPPTSGNHGGRWPRPVMSVADAAETGDRTVASSAGRVNDAMVRDLLRQRADLPADHPDRATLRARSVEMGLPLAQRLARKYRGYGEPLDDLYQVAALALVQAVDRYDPARQTAFASYAVPTILGALKRHFRDATWRVRVSRPVQDLAVSLNQTSADLAQHLARTPTRRDLARHLDAAEQDITDALDAWQARHPESLDALLTPDGEDQRPLIDMLGAIDPCLDTVANRQTLRPLLAALDVRQRRILAMRYFGELTQAEIAAQIGVSQMQVSRLLAGTLAELRTSMLAEKSPHRYGPGNNAHNALLARRPISRSRDDPQQSLPPSTDL